jgi:hypothetical protein
VTLTPATRRLEIVLRNALAPADSLRVLVATYDSTPSADPRYANIVLDGQALTVPNLNAVPAGAPGAPVYVLAENSRMWVLGAVTATGPTASGPAFIAKPGAPTSADGRDGDSYLDTSSLRLYGPKAGGVWPAAAGRIMPLTPTYAQLKSG